MTKLPSARKLVRVLTLHGFMLVSQRGSHQKYSNGVRIVIVPAPSKEIPLGTVRSISRQSGIAIEEFLNL
ncbi:MAG: type II toxin-antitoxin system HicA family toxin [Bacteroidales bacterium]